MTSAERPIDYNKAVSDFLKLHEREMEVQAIKLTRFYGVDLHELSSRTRETVWKKWPSEFCPLPDNERYKRARSILFNHARNLSKNTRRDEGKCEVLPGEELERLAHTISACQDPVAAEAIFEDERLAIYKAISLLDGRCRDVMTLVALGLGNSEIRQELGMTVTNLTSTLGRARKSLRESLRLGDKGESGEPR